MLPNFDWPMILERQRRELEFVELLADGGGIQVNGIPWRDAFARINVIVGDPMPWLTGFDDPFHRTRPRPGATRRRRRSAARS